MKTDKVNKQNNSKQTNDSNTKVYFSDYQAVRYFANQRQVCSFRADSGIWRRYKQLARRVYGSICRGIEIYMVNFIEACERGVYFSNTEKPIKFEKVVIERNLRPRRKLEVVDDDVDEGEGVKCCFCGRSAVGFYQHLSTGEVVPLCEFHSEHLRLNYRFVRWVE